MDWALRRGVILGGNSAQAVSFAVGGPSGSMIGVPITITVTALDAYGRTATSYLGTVAFTSSDGAAVLPSSSTLSSGTGTFSVTLNTAGSQTITATDTVKASITGSMTVLVSAAGVYIPQQQIIVHPNANQAIYMT